MHCRTACAPISLFFPSLLLPFNLPQFLLLCIHAQDLYPFLNDTCPLTSICATSLLSISYLSQLYFSIHNICFPQLPFQPSVGTDADSFIWCPWYRLLWLNISSSRTGKGNHLAEPLNQIISKTTENERTHAHIRIYTHVCTTVIMHQYIMTVMWYILCIIELEACFVGYMHGCATICRYGSLLLFIIAYICSNIVTFCTICKVVHSLQTKRSQSHARMMFCKQLSSFAQIWSQVTGAH